MLRQGGNAVDAAVAAAFTSFIAEAVLVNIGGGGIAQVYDPATGQVVSCDFFSNMPGLARNGQTPAAEIDFREILVDFGPAQQPFYIGRGSVAVPGVVAGLCQMVEDLGTLPLSQILAPAIRLARQGAVMSDALAYVAAILAPILTDTAEIAARYALDGKIAGAGDTLYFPDLANTLEQLGREGPALFYTGAVAQTILADQQAHQGLLTKADLVRYQVYQAASIAVDYRDCMVQLPPPSSNGGVLIAFALKLLASVSLKNISHNGFDHLRLLAEVMRLSNIARAQWESDCGLDAAWTTRSNQTECIDKFLANDNIMRYSQMLKEILAGRRDIPDSDVSKGPASTTHISVADTNGIVVGITTSAGENAGFVVADTGIMLNNMLGEIDLHPNGFHQLAAGQRLITMMSPTIVLRQGQPVLAVGSGGSSRLRTAILQVISNFIDFTMPLAEAVDAPRLHFEANMVQLEGGIAPEVADQLEAAGYRVNRWPERNMFFGGAHAVARSTDLPSQDQGWVAAGDRRRGGSIVVV